MPRPKPLPIPKPERRSWHAGSVVEVRPGVWRAFRERTRTADGKVRRSSKTFRDKPSAERWAKGDPEPAVMYLGQWLERWLALIKPTVSANTFDLYERAVAACEDLRNRPIADLTVEDWQRQTNLLLERWSRYHVFVWRGNIGTALRAAIPRYLTSNPLERVKLPKADEQPPKAWRQDELDRLLAACAGTIHEPWLLFLLGTGVRLGEARALRWDDVDHVHRTATIRASLDDKTASRGPTKTRRVRVVDIPDEVMVHLVARRARQAPGEQLVFGRGGRPYGTTTYRLWLRRRCRAAGVRELSPHSARHTYASLAFDANPPVPVQDVARQLGHSVLTCTRIYAHFIGDGLRRAANALGAALTNRFSGPKGLDGSADGSREAR